MVFVSEAAKEACLESMEAESWTGIDMLLRAARVSSVNGKSPASLVLEAYVWKELSSGRVLEWKSLKKQVQGTARLRYT